jgi:FMN phosphatase YigB (HAD superfamily)
MIMIKLTLFLLLTMISLHAKIIQTNTMEEILPYIDEDTWVIFDIDNVLLEPSIQAGRHEWFLHEVEKFMARGVDFQTAEELVGPCWRSFMEICPMRTPEPDIASLIKTIQEKSGASLALTARHPPDSTLTLRQLEALEIDFSHHAPLFVSFEAAHPTHWEKGIFFVSWMNSKGIVFRQFIENSDIQPKRIVFIDDTKRHVDSMEQELQKLGIEFFGFHYIKTSERPFDPKMADKEYREIVALRNPTHRLPILAE